MKAILTLMATILALSGAWAQSVIPGVGPQGPRRLKPADEAVFDLGESRNDLSCSVAPSKPELGFDFLFQTGYRLSIPIRELTGPENLLTIVFRVVALNHEDEPVYFSQRFRVPAIQADAPGNVMLEGQFLLGEGTYHVDWLVRDFNERVCARTWDLNAKVGAKDGLLTEALAQNVIQPVESTFVEESPVTRGQSNLPLNVKVIVNFAPQSLGATTLSPSDRNGLVSILRKIGRESRIDSYSIVACSVQAQRVN